VCAKEIKEKMETGETIIFRGGLFFCYLFWYSEKKYYFCTDEKFVPKNVVLV
jgi:hypothetical protein